MDNHIIQKDIKDIHHRVDLSELNGKTVLLTGASGLIGTYLTASLVEFVEAGNSLKRLYLMINHNLPDHLKYVEEKPWISIIQGDLTDSDFLKTLPAADYIIHAAGYAQPSLFMKNQATTLKLNTIATFALLDKLNKDGKFVFISSSAVYTGSDKIPFNEDSIGNSNTNHPRSCYIEGKRSGEAITLAYRNAGVNAKVARFSITYGPGARHNDIRALYSFIRKGIEDKRIELLDDGSAQKVYCYITDAIEILWNILLHGKADIYNVAGEEKTTILEIAKRVGELTDAEVLPKENVGNGVAGAIQAEVLDMNRVNNEFGKRDYVSIDEGIKSTVEWSKANWYI